MHPVELDPPPRIAAVLVLVYPHGGEPHIVFTRRSEALREHGGQMSLPGGARDPSDADLAATALREAQEEVGVPACDVQLLGSLSEVHVAASNFMITPHVGTLTYRPSFTPNPSEVAEIVEIPLRALQDPAAFHEEIWELRGQARPVQFYEHGRHQIWGATARVVQEFLSSVYVDLAAAALSPARNTSLHD
ncbi:MAG: CoA pyrophosphatase [Chloroflexi bacterium]|nr:CoA pyrophosphatase [Chloroflexota bacterium]